MANSSIYNRLFEKQSKIKKGGSIDSLLKMLEVKKWFLVLVFANLIFQLGITYFVMEKTEDAEKRFNYWQLFGLSIAIIIVLAFVPQMPPFIKFLLFSAFSYVTGIVLSILKKMYTEGEIRLALESAMGIFITMFISALTLIVVGVQLGYKFILPLIGVLLLMLCIRIFYTPTKMVSKGIAIIFVAIFSLLIVYDTQQILRRDYYGDFITASIDYYLDIVNIFTDMLFIQDG
jgi:FtsH-binding integral membrane protein